MRDSNKLLFTKNLHYLARTSFNNLKSYLLQIIDYDTKKLEIYQRGIVQIATEMS